jgi:hypothetical protein
LAKEKTDGARQSKRAYKALTKIEAADKTVHQQHRKYEGAVAENELGKKRSDAGLAKKLHSMRPGYARLGLGIDKADSDARTRIDEIKAKLTGGKLMRAMYLANYFVAGCIAFSLLGWVASLHPIAFRAVLCLLAAIAIAWGLSWLLDFSLSKLLKISVADLQALLIGGLAMLLIGLGVFYAPKTVCAERVLCGAVVGSANSARQNARHSQSTARGESGCCDCLCCIGWVTSPANCLSKGKLRQLKNVQSLPM